MPVNNSSSGPAKEAMLAAQTAAQQAAASAASATAVVTGGTAALTPTAGKIPIADNNGIISLDWLGSDVATRIRLADMRINDIGIAGRIGFGVGICPSTPSGYTALAGTYTLGNNDYGNYQY